MPDGKIDLDLNSVGELIVDVVATVLDGDDAAAPAAGYDGDGLAAVAAEGE